MTDRYKSTFARRARAADKPRAKRHDVRDDVVSGLILRVYPSGKRTFSLDTMIRGRRRYATIGNADEMTIPEARREARRLIASYIEPARTDSGPRTPGHPMTDFAGEFLERHGRHWKPRTVEANSRIVRKDILPVFGHMTVDAIAADDVKRWFASMGERPGIANHVMPVLSVMMRMAELWGYRAHNTNPCKRTHRYRMKPKERFLTAQEMARLNAVLTVLLPPDRRHRPPADADRLPLRRGHLARMGLDQGQAHPPSRLEIRAAHGLAVERRPRGHRRHPALRRGLSVSVSDPPANAARGHHRLPLGPNPQ